MNKRVLCVTYFLRSQKGGIQAYLRYLEKGLTQYGWQVETIFLDDVISLPILGGRSWIAGLFRTSPFLRNLFDNWRVSVTKNLLKKLAVAVKKKILIQSFDVIHAQDPYAAFAILPLAQNKKIPLVITNHGPVMRESEFGPAYKNFVDLIERRAYQNAKAIILVGEHLKSSVLPKAHNTPYFVIHNAIDIDGFLSEGQKEYPNLPKSYILIVARLDPEKGVDVGLQAFQQVLEKHSDLNLVIVGDGRLKGELKKLAFHLGITKRIQFLGWVSSSDISALYRKAKIVWITSRPFRNIQEPLGIVALEAMAWGRPIVASQIGGLAEVFSKGGALLVPSDNPQKLAEATLTLLKDSLLAKKIGEEAQKIARENYDINQWIKKILDVYSRVQK